MPKSGVNDRRKYLRHDLNLVDEARVRRLKRLCELDGDCSGSALLRRILDDEARRRGVYDDGNERPARSV